MKRTLFCFGISDLKGVEDYLNRQAAKGWELEKAGALFARWKRTERTDLTWCVDLEKPRQTREERREYFDLCAQAGWELVTIVNGWYLFKSRPGTKPVPVQTDEGLEKKDYNQYFLRGLLPIVIYIAVMAALVTAAGGPDWSALGQLRDVWMFSWAKLGLLVALPVSGVWCVWKVLHFGAGLIRSRGGKIARPPRWAMWTDCVLTGLDVLALAVYALGFGAESLLMGRGVWKIWLYLAILGIASLCRAVAIDRELFAGERKRWIKSGVAALAVMVVLLIGGKVTPFGELSYNWWWPSGHVSEVRYGQSMEKPIVHGEDLGIELDLLGGEAVDVTWAIAPAGEVWWLNYCYAREEPNDYYKGCGSCTVFAISEGMAKAAARALVNNSRSLETWCAHWPEEGLTAVDIPWADEAWYWSGVSESVGVELSILVLRVGETVTRLVYPAERMAGENLQVIRQELGV